MTGRPRRRALRVVLVGRAGLMRDALAQLVAADGSLRLVASFDRFHPGARALHDAIDVDVALVELPDRSGLAVISGSDLAGWTAGGIEPVDAVTVGWDAEPDDLLALLRLAGAGTLPRPVATPDDPLRTLTCKEVEVLALLALGWSTASVAEALGISINTLRTHIGRILDKLGVHSRFEAVSLARSIGLSSTRTLTPA